MRTALLPTLVLALAAAAQDAPETKYTNDELGVDFVGVYGWDIDRPEGSGAWTKLVSYSNSAFQAEVDLLVRPNPFADTTDLRAALKAEFPEGGDPAVGKPAYKEVTLSDAEMKRGNQLPGIQVEAIQISISEEGKKREQQLLIATYLGANRLFRVHCEAPRARARRVRDLFDRALSGLTVTASDEKVVTGVPFRSERGAYHCLIPETFGPVLPLASRPMEIDFTSRKLGVRISVYSYAFRGDQRDHVDELADYYGGDFKVTNEDARHFGGLAFDGILTRDQTVTHITGAVRDGRIYRIHTYAAAESADNAKRVHAEFLEGFRIGN